MRKLVNNESYYIRQVTEHGLKRNKDVSVSPTNNKNDDQ